MVKTAWFRSQKFEIPETGRDNPTFGGEQQVRQSNQEYKMKECVKRTADKGNEWKFWSQNLKERGNFE